MSRVKNGIVILGIGIGGKRGICFVDLIPIIGLGQEAAGY